MPVLHVGATEIPYRIRHSTAAKRKRIVVTPDAVEVVAPPDQDEAEIAAFMHDKRRWVYDKREQLREQALDEAFPSRFATGGKVLFRGRRLRLFVELADVPEPMLEYRNAFHVRAPSSLDEKARDTAIADTLSTWMRSRVQDDAAAFIRRYVRRLGVSPGPLRIKEQRHLWGSCGKDGSINLNWHLVFAPKPVLEYAVVHELCHLEHRNHSAAFWDLVGSVLPDYRPRARYLASLNGWGL